MLHKQRMSPEEIRNICEQNPKMRARDIAAMFGIKEVQLVSAFCGHRNARIRMEMDNIFRGLANVGEVLALTRNESAVHEKVGVYDKYHSGKHASMMLGEAIDTRMFPKHFVHGFLVKKETDKGIKQSLQFFDAQGDAVHKIHSCSSTDMLAWDKLMEELHHSDQTQELDCVGRSINEYADEPIKLVEQLKSQWEKMTDTHQFVGIIRKLKLSRHQAVKIIGDEFAWKIDKKSIEKMMRQSADKQLPIMCFVGSQGCIQIHSGPIQNIKRMGHWLNIMDEGFHLHLRTDQIEDVWVVRKPTDKGHVTSIEAYNASGELVIQFFGKRVEGHDEREIWRDIVEGLQRFSVNRAA